MLLGVLVAIAVFILVVVVTRSPTPILDFFGLGTFLLLATTLLGSLVFAIGSIAPTVYETSKDTHALVSLGAVNRELYFVNSGKVDGADELFWVTQDDTSEIFHDQARNAVVHYTDDPRRAYVVVHHWEGSSWWATSIFPYRYGDTYDIFVPKQGVVPLYQP